MIPEKPSPPKGWRKLKPGTLIERGDRVWLWGFGGKDWHTPSMVGHLVVNGYYIRKIKKRKENQT